MKAQELANQATEININIEELERLIELNAAFQRIKENPDFKKVFDQDLFKEEPSRLLLLKASPYIKQDGHTLRAIEEKQIMIGELFNHFLAIPQRAEQAKRDIEADRETRESILNEQLEAASGELQ